MSVFKKFLARFREPYEVNLEEADEFFQEKKQKELEKAEEKADERRKEIRQQLQDLGRELEKLKKHKDEKGRAIIEDVAENVADDRKNMISEINLQASPDKLYDQLDQFLDDFQMMTKKEAAVMENVPSEVSGQLEKLKKSKKKLGEFLDSEYPVVEKLDELEAAVEELERLDEEEEHARDRIEELEEEQMSEELQEKKEELEELHESAAWEDYQETQERLDELQDEKRSVKNEMGRVLGKIERGMKKLVYQAENDELELEHLDVLKQVRDGELEKLREKPEEVEAAVEEAREKLPSDLLGEAQEEKMLGAIKELETFTGYTENLVQLEEEIRSTKEDIQEREILQKEKRLEREIDSLSRKVEEEGETRKELRERLDDIDEERRETIEHVKDVLDSEFVRKIEYKEEKRYQ